MEIFSGGFAFIIFLVVVFFVMSVKVLNEYERGVIFRLGRIIGAKGPGLIILIPVIGQVEMDELLSARDAVNHKLQAILDNQTENWGIKVSNVEVKQIDLPIEMQRAMARQAEAERDRRAKVIAAEGELQASEKLSE